LSGSSQFVQTAPVPSSDGGALLLQAADQKLQLTAALAASLVDGRQATKVKHSLTDLLRQRIYGLASGYADANDGQKESRKVSCGGDYSDFDFLHCAGPAAINNDPKGRDTRDRYNQRQGHL